MLTSTRRLRPERLECDLSLPGVATGDVRHPAQPSPPQAATKSPVLRRIDSVSEIPFNPTRRRNGGNMETRTYSIAEVSAALGQSAERLEQWISRGHLKPSDPRTARGRRGRRWSFHDVLKVQALCDLSVGGVAVDQKGAVEMIPPDAKDGFLVLSAKPGKLREVQLIGGGTVVDRGRATYEARVVSRREIEAALQDPEVVTVTILSLASLRRRVEAALAALSPAKPTA
jgi:hypothetical protein